MADSLSEGVNLNRDIDKTMRSVEPLYKDSFTASRDRSEQGDALELIFTVGLPASGKSTWATNFCHSNSKCVRVSRDDLRNMRGEYWIPDQEDMISDWELRTTALALEWGKNVIIDATNLSEKRRLQFIGQLRDRTNKLFTHKTKIFDTPVEECIKRDEKRTEGKVGKKVILQMANRYGLQTKYPEYRFQAGLPSAIICDLDGTLAHNTTGRGFYSWSRVGEDEVDTEIRRMLEIYRNMPSSTKIIIMSGRDGICQPETTQWLNDNGVDHDMLVMRSAGDQRKDSIIKRELFENHIKDRYNVMFALDDRDQVVDMWRKELGIKCLQVNYGDF